MITPQGCPFNCAAHPCTVEYRAGMLPQTDRLLERAINLSVGVVDRGLGAAFGVNPRSTDEEVDRAAKQFVEAVRAAV
jgi:8-amino-3,8-dideoxy-alpha-D-manno-octulosonate transaminase